MNVDFHRFHLSKTQLVYWKGDTSQSQPKHQKVESWCSVLTSVAILYSKFKKTYLHKYY